MGHGRVSKLAGGEVPEAATPGPTNCVSLPYYTPPRAREAIVLEMASDEPEPVLDAAWGSFKRGTIAEVVIGDDDRVAVADGVIKLNPWRQICALRIRAATGRNYVGTGWFIAPNVLATAGHCVYMLDEGGWASSIEVIPALSGEEAPFGTARATSFAAVDGWVQGHAREFDYGVIFLDDSDLGLRLGNFEVQALTDTELDGVVAKISGYPADRDRATVQYFHERPLMGVSPTVLEYDIDTFGGQSGSPIWQHTEERGLVAIGIHTNGALSGNSGTRINADVLENLMSWIDAGP
jgi:V8-like Glu-specific endopeptidase